MAIVMVIQDNQIISIPNYSWWQLPILPHQLIKVLVLKIPTIWFSSSIISHFHFNHHCKAQQENHWMRWVQVSQNRWFHQSIFHLLLELFINLCFKIQDQLDKPLIQIRKSKLFVHQFQKWGRFFMGFHQIILKRLFQNKVKVQ